MKKNIKPAIYYLFIGSIVITQTITTLFNSAVSLTIHARYNAQEKEKMALNQEINRLQTEVAKKISIASVKQSPFQNDFMPISDVVSLKVSDTLATIQ